MWSAEAALNDLWAGLDVTAPAGDVRAYLKKHLEAAHEADRPDPTVHYAMLIRLQVAMSALQDLLAADEDESPERVAEARENASAAIQIALGGQIDVPARLMRNWADAQMKRDAARVLAAIQ